MKIIMIPIQPKFAKLEMNGKKTIELRKFCVEPPFKVVNYVTKYGNDSLVFSTDYEDVAWNRPYIDKEHNRVWTTLHGNYLKKLCKDKIWNGKVAFEYVVNKVDTYRYEYDYETEEGYYDIDDDMLEECCLTLEEIIEYGNRNDISLYHISDLRIYDKPKALREFRKPCNHKIVYGEKVSSCGGCRMWRMNYKTFTYECILGGKVKITRPPQNFVYIEEIRCCQSEEEK